MDKGRYSPEQGNTGIEALQHILQHFGCKLNPPEFQQAHQEKDSDLTWQRIKDIAKAYKLKGDMVKPTAAELRNQSFPAIASMVDGSFAYILMVNDEVVYLIDFREKRPMTVSIKDFLDLWYGELFVFHVKYNWAYIKKRYNIDWFMKVFWHYKRTVCEVLIACFFIQVMGIGMPLITQVVIDKVIGNNGYSTLTVIGISMCLFFIVQGMLTGLKTYFMNHTTVKLDAILGSKMFRHLISIPLPYYQSRRVGETLLRVNAVTNIREFFTGQGLTTVLYILFSVVFIAFMLLYSVPLTLIALLIVPMYLVQNVWAVPILRKKIVDMSNAAMVNDSFMVESLTNMETVKSLAVEPQMVNKWETLLARYVSKTFDNMRFNLVLNGFSDTIQMISSLGILWYGGHMVMEGEFTLGQLIAFQMIAGQAITPLGKLFTMWPELQKVIIGLEMMGDILNTAIEPVLMPNIGRRANPLSGRIQLRNIVFRYRMDAPEILKDVSLDVEPGTKLGIVGRSGSGKSTLANIIQYMYMPEKGEILFDGMPIKELNLNWLRSQIGVVMQDSYLFDSSIRDNIAINHPDAAMDMVINAAKLAGAHEFILELQEGYDTKVGERGAALSGGQRQRIAIARALMDRPGILIFDEATSALDYESEGLVMRNINQLKCTMIIIAHRLSTVRNCDRIIVMDDGKIVESGTHEELMRTQGMYYRLYRLQKES